MGEKKNINKHNIQSHLWSRPLPTSTTPQRPIKAALHLALTLKRRRRLLCERDEGGCSSQWTHQSKVQWAAEGDWVAHLLQITAVRGGEGGEGGRLPTASPWTLIKDFSSPGPWFPYLFLFFFIFCFHYSPGAWEGKTLTLRGNNGDKKKKWKVELPVWSCAWEQQPSRGLWQPRDALRHRRARASLIRRKISCWLGSDYSLSKLTVLSYCTTKNIKTRKTQTEKGKSQHMARLQMFRQ